MDTANKGASPLDDLAVAIVLPLLLLGAVGIFDLWLGAAASALLFHQSSLGVGVGAAARAFFSVAHWTGDHRAGWPATVPLGPAPAYWAITSLLWAMSAAAAVLLIRKTKQGPEVKARTRLGASTKESFAEMDDLDTLRVDEATFGRFILGVVDGTLVATEHRRLAPAPAPRGEREHPRQGDISSVAIIGATRSGKTVNVVGGIMDWMGPAILSSVKGDLLQATIKHRETLGEVYVYDPLRSLDALEGYDADRYRAGWTPLTRIRSLEDAQRETTALADAAPTGGAENSNYFVGLSSKMIAPLLWVASKTGRNMGDVVRWINLQDSALKPTPLNPNPPAEVRGLLDGIERDVRDARETEELLIARQALSATWDGDDRTRGNTYTTAGLLVKPWESEGVREADVLDVQVTLDWLLGGDGYRTLYLCTNVEEKERLGPVFGGLVASLVNDVYRRTAGAAPLTPPLLCVLDEAANTPNKKLPSIASTCAGLGVLLITVWQSLSQIQAAFGQLAGDVVTNHGTKLLYAGASDVDTLRYATDLTGEEDVFTKHEKRGDDDRGPSESVSLGNLLPMGQLRRALPGTALMIHGTLPPIELLTRKWWLDDRLVALSEGGGADWTPGAEPGNPAATKPRRPPGAPGRRSQRRSDKSGGGAATNGAGEPALSGMPAVSGAPRPAPDSGGGLSGAAAGGDSAFAAPPSDDDMDNLYGGNEDWPAASGESDYLTTVADLARDDAELSTPGLPDWPHTAGHFPADAPADSHPLYEAPSLEPVYHPPEPPPPPRGPVVAGAHVRRHDNRDEEEGGGGGAAIADGGDTGAVRMQLTAPPPGGEAAPSLFSDADIAAADPSALPPPTPAAAPTHDLSLAAAQRRRMSEGFPVD